MSSCPSIEKSKSETAPTITIGTSVRSMDSLSLDIPSLPLTASDVASSDSLDYINLFASTALDPNVAHGATFDENDIIIALMGPTGAGRSSFVNTAVGRAEAMVGHTLASQTRKIQPVRCPHPDGRRNIVLVDTPGFDDSHLSDAQILKMIADWLKATYQKNIKLAGVLYLTDIRMSRTPLKNLAIFKDLCGERYMRNVIIITTMWDLEDASVAFQREEELRSKFWKDMIHLGSQTCRYWGTHASAWKIIKQLNLEGPRQPLQIQREMVDRRMQLQETTLFRNLRPSKTIWER